MRNLCTTVHGSFTQNKIYDPNGADSLQDFIETHPIVWVFTVCSEHTCYTSITLTFKTFNL